MATHSTRGVPAAQLAAGVSLFVACVLGACRVASQEPVAGLQQELKAAFARVNSRVAYVKILGVCPSPSADDEYAVLATAGANTSDSVRMENELFGVFIADSSLGHVKRTLDVFASKRWHDYTIRFDTTPAGSLEVAGAGEMYGDGATHRVYDWSPGATRALIREYVGPGDTTADSE